MEALKTHLKALGKEALYFLASSSCIFIIYALIKGMILPFMEHQTDKEYVGVLIIICLDLACTYLFTRLHVGWKYSFRNRGDYEIIREYKDKRIEGIIKETRSRLKSEAYFVIVIAIASAVAMVFEPLIYPIKCLYLFNDIMHNTIGGAISFVLILATYFLNLYLYRVRVYKEFYVPNDKK